ncbi:MAG TPA: hypothetical protein VGQ46_07840 [Thermoanaerobaculia bacterium]|jgi:hypothetical protein|nr:hypothetical protein [Thermoanaerobaculia bacterium]
MQRAFVVCLLLTAFSYSAIAADNRKAEVVGAVSTPFIKALQNLSAERTTSSILSLKPVPNVVLEGAESAFIFPVVGSAGAFRTEAVIFNRLDRSQLVDVYFLPLGGGSCNVGAVRLRLDANTWYFYSDFVFDVFSKVNFGSVVAFGVTSGGNTDSSARIDGNARIWSVDGGGGTTSQNFPAMSIAVPGGGQSAFGLRKDEFYRTNWGIFNYDSVTRTFDLTFNGLRGFSTLSVNIPPCSLVQQGVPGGPYGSFEIYFSPRDGGGLYYAYGSSVDNISGDAWNVPGRR